MIYSFCIHYLNIEIKELIKNGFRKFNQNSMKIPGINM